MYCMTFIAAARECYKTNDESTNMASMYQAVRNIPSEVSNRSSLECVPELSVPILQQRPKIDCISSATLPVLLERREQDAHG